MYPGSLSSALEIYTKHAESESNRPFILLALSSTLGPAYNEQRDAKETGRYKWLLVVTEL